MAGEPRQIVMEHTTAGDPVAGETFEINMGPQHPATHGVLRLVLTLDGETGRLLIIETVYGGESPRER